MIDGKSQVDPHSETWLAVKAELNAAIKANQRICETPGQPLTDTENARGALALARGLLKLGGEGTSQTPQSE